MHSYEQSNKFNVTIKDLTKYPGFSSLSIKNCFVNKKIKSLEKFSVIVQSTFSHLVHSHTLVRFHRNLSTSKRSFIKLTNDISSLSIIN